MVLDNSEEKLFRERYSERLRELRDDQELRDEREKVKLQSMKTPGRRGEEIKHEEIDRETVRRYSSKVKVNAS